MVVVIVAATTTLYIVLIFILRSIRSVSRDLEWYEPGSRPSATDSKCDELAKQYGLTSREREVLAYIAQGCMEAGLPEVQNRGNWSPFVAHLKERGTRLRARCRFTAGSLQIQNSQPRHSPGLGVQSCSSNLNRSAQQLGSGAVKAVPSSSYSPRPAKMDSPHINPLPALGDRSDVDHGTVEPAAYKLGIGSSLLSRTSQLTDVRKPP